jgi:hypothetical protein
LSSFVGHSFDISLLKNVQKSVATSDEKLLIIDVIEQTKKHFPEIYKHINNTYNANIELSLEIFKDIDFLISNRIDLEPSTTPSLESVSCVDNAKVTIKNDRGSI